MKCRRFRCPACGLFNRRARRRARDWADRLHINWAASLIAPRPASDVLEVRSEPERPWRADHEITLHTHAPEVECRGEASGCRSYPRKGALIQVSHTPTPPKLATYVDSADEIAEVVGPLSYEEQSEMFGDPIADVIRKETE